MYEENRESDNLSTTLEEFQPISVVDELEENDYQEVTNSILLNNYVYNQIRFCR